MEVSDDFSWHFYHLYFYVAATELNYLQLLHFLDFPAWKMTAVNGVDFVFCPYQPAFWNPPSESA